MDVDEDQPIVALYSPEQDPDGFMLRVERLACNQLTQVDELISDNGKPGSYYLSGLTDNYASVSSVGSSATFLLLIVCAPNDTRLIPTRDR